MRDAQRPRLEIVEGGASPRPAGAAPAEEAPKRSSWWIPALAGVLALSLLAMGLEARRAARLEAQVQELTGQLTAAESALEAHRRHLDQVRSSVADLQALVGLDPAAEPR